MTRNPGRRSRPPSAAGWDEGVAAWRAVGQCAGGGTSDARPASPGTGDAGFIRIREAERLGGGAAAQDFARRVSVIRTRLRWVEQRAPSAHAVGGRWETGAAHQFVRNAAQPQVRRQDGRRLGATRRLTIGPGPQQVEDGVEAVLGRLQLRCRLTQPSLQRRHGRGGLRCKRQAKRGRLLRVRPLQLALAIGQRSEDCLGVVDSQVHAGICRAPSSSAPSSSWIVAVAPTS